MSQGPRSSLRALWLALLALSLALPAAAHRLAPSFLSMEIGDDGQVSLLWKTPQVVARGARVEPALPEHCRPTSDAAVRPEATAWVTELTLDCGARGLVGSTLRVDGLEASGTDALIRLAFADGREVRSILTKESPEFVVPERESAGRVFTDYLRLGFEHLLTGADHLLFVLGLMLLMPDRRRILIGVTAFTAGHSLTLALAALGLLGLPQELVELAIAATLVALGREALRADREQSFLVRRPWLAPGLFGLVHGLGFAGALAALGLPGHAIPMALFAFNVGIELAQLAVVLAGWWAVRAIVRGRASLPRLVAELPATVIGSMGVAWCLDRGLGLLGL